MNFDQVVTQALVRANAQIQDNPTPEQLAVLLHGLSAIKRATIPLTILAFDLTDMVTINQSIYVLTGIAGSAYQLVVNGVVIRRRFWGWDKKTYKLAMLNSFRIQPGQVAELYYVPK